MMRPPPTSTPAAPQPPGADGVAALFAPRGIAVVGASQSSGKLGAVLARSLDGFAGHVALVNPGDASMVPSVAAAAEHGPVDVAMLCVPAHACPAALEEAATGGAQAAVVCSGGFAEANQAGAQYQRELAAVAARTGIRVLGPNTSGFIRPRWGLTASFVPGASDVSAGRVAVLAASGGVNHALAFALTEAGHGVSLAVGLGNGCDITTPGMLEALATDSDTSAVALHVEAVSDGRHLTAALAHLTQTRPVVALVAGRHDAGTFAASHTGALTSSWRTTRAALAQAGAVVVDDERELVDAVGALSRVRLPPTHSRGAGVGVVTAQAGPGLLLLDELRGRSLAVPELTPSTQHTLAELLPPITFHRNPVDTGRPDPQFGRVLATVAHDPNVAAVAGYALHEPTAVDLPAAAAHVQTAAPQAPLLLAVGGAGHDVAATRRDLLARGIPTATDPRGLATMTAALLADAHRRSRVTTEVPQPVPGVEPGLGPWDEHAAKTMLDQLGITTPARRACATHPQAHRALAELSGPVAVKLLDASTTHKTEHGGVHLGVQTPRELDAALAALDAASATRYLLEAMAPEGVDLLVGAHRDPVFGPVVLVGLGGTRAETTADVALRLAPLAEAEAATMPENLAGAAALDGARGETSLDRLALAQTVVALGALLHTCPQIAAVEINPLRVTHTGLLALDAVCLARNTKEDHDGDTPA